MRTWHFADADGRPTRQSFAGPERALAANTPIGCRAVEGEPPMDLRDDPEATRDRARMRIAELEQRQLRPMRELTMDPTNAEAARRLTAIDSEITSLRETLDQTSKLAQPQSMDFDIEPPGREEDG